MMTSNQIHRALLLAGAITAASSALAMAEPVRLSPNEVTLGQIFFEDDLGGGGWSAWGTLTVDPVAAARAAGADAGYVSMRTDQGWVVFNLPIQSHPERDWPARVARQGLPAPRVVAPMRVDFDLGTTKQTSYVPALVVFSATPLASKRDFSALDTIPLQKFAVTPIVENEQGGITVPPPGGLPPGPELPPSVQFPPDLKDTWTVSLPHNENVNAAHNQCATMAAANSLAFLSDTFGLQVPHGHVKGYGDGLTLVGQLDMFSHRPAPDTCNGKGTFHCIDNSHDRGLLNGIFTYLDDYWLTNDVRIYTQGDPDGNPDNCASLPQNQPTTEHDGNAVTFDWVCDHIKNGDAVILTFVRYEMVNNAEEPYSAHAVRIYGCGSAAGEEYLMALDDGWQDGMDDDVCMENGSLQWKSWPVSDVDNDGSLNINGLWSREITWAMAIEAI